MCKLILILILIFFQNTIAQAYIGPGIGAGVILATLGVIFAIFASIFGIIWFPIKRFLKNKKTKKKNGIK